MKEKIFCYMVITLVFISSISMIAEVTANQKNNDTINMKQTPVYLTTSNQNYEVKIVRPLKGYLYINNNELFPIFLSTIALGSITIQAETIGDGIGRVEFYLDGVLEHTDYTRPYTWKTNTQMQFKHQLTVKAYGVNRFQLDTILAEDERDIWMFNSKVQPDNPPEPWITFPAGNGLLQDPEWKTTIISSELVPISAVELHLAQDIVSAVFEYSKDGINWVEIGTDSYGGYLGYLMPIGSLNRKMGDEGWNTIWHTTSLTEGNYFIRATMTDENGQQGTDIKEVYYDPIPPKPIIVEPSFYEEIRGIVPFIVQSNDPNIVSTSLYVYQGPTYIFDERNYYKIGTKGNDDGFTRQTGHGRANENTQWIGENPDNGEKQYCAPTAVANALGVLNDKKLLEEDDNTSRDTEYDKTANKLAEHMNTDRNYGTDYWLTSDSSTDFHVTSSGRIYTHMLFDNVGSGIQSYLNEKGVGCNNASGYEVTKYSITLNWSFKDVNGNPTDEKYTPVPGSNQVTFENYSKEIRKNQAVTFAMEKYDKETNMLELENGHVVTGRGYKNEANEDGSRTIEIIDPAGRYVANAKAPVYQGNLTEEDGFSLFEYKNETYIISGMWAISKKQETTEDCAHIGDAENAVIYCDTTNFVDGYYAFIVETTDINGFVGRETILVEINNTVIDNDPPTVVITSPEDNTVVTDSFIEVFGLASDDESGIVEIVYQWESAGDSSGDTITYDPPRSDISFLIEISTLYPGSNEVSVVAVDDFGNTASDSITIMYDGGEDTTPPVTVKEIGQPNSDGGYVVSSYTPIWLNATDSGSGVQYIYYEMWWDSDEDMVVDVLMGTYTVTSDTVELHFEDVGIYFGIAELHWYAVDNAGNQETIHIQEHLVQATK